MTLKIYTKVGDQGKTKQVSGKLVPKYDLQIETLGNPTYQIIAKF